MRPAATTPFESAPEAALSRLSEAAVSAALVDIQAHGLELIASAALRERGMHVAPALTAAERVTAMTILLTPAVLTEIRNACDGRILLMKGPEVAAHYPDAALRGYNDLDLLVDDADAAHKAMLRAGFRPVGNPKLFEGIHHLRPVALFGGALPVEVHSRPKWVTFSDAPDFGTLAREAVPSATSIAGIEAPSPAHHVLLLAVHSWAHEPLRRLRDLLDIAVLAPACAAGEIDEWAAAFGVERIWSATKTALATLCHGTRLPMPISLWARNIERCRERTVLEDHLERWLSGFASQSPLAATRGLKQPLRQTFAPDYESASQKLRRSYHAVRNAHARRSEHVASVETLLPPPFGER